MRLIEIDLPDVRVGEWHHLTPLSDLHMEAAGHDAHALEKLRVERTALPNHHVALIGDTGDWILPGDKRYRPAAGNSDVKGRDDYINAALEKQVETLSKWGQVDWVTMGNHENTLLSKTGLDPIKLLARQLDAAYGGYCGFVRYKMHLVGGATQPFVVMYHHGAWTGKTAIPLAAVQYAQQQEGWHVFLFGHSHHLSAERRGRFYLPRSTKFGQAVARDSVIVVCGTHLRNYVDVDGRGPGYEEQKALPPTAIGAALVKWRVVESTPREQSLGLPRRRVEVRVDV